MKRHELKTWPGPFEAIILGLKTHEIRKNDRGFEEADLLYLREWDSETKAYSGRAIEVRVTYISRGPHWGLPEGLVVMSIDRASDLITDSYPPELTDPDVLADLLSMTPYPVPTATIRTWTPEEIKSAADWASEFVLARSSPMLTLKERIDLPGVPPHVSHGSPR